MAPLVLEGRGNERPGQPFGWGKLQVTQWEDGRQSSLLLWTVSVLSDFKVTMLDGAGSWRDDLLGEDLNWAGEGAGDSQWLDWQL